MSTAEATAELLAPVAPAAPQGTGTIRFLGSERAYWRLLVRGAVLLLLTLGIYRFWLVTDMRRFLWAHTEVAGDILEYVGTARELLLGFLVAVAVLVPLYTLFFIASLGVLGEWAALVAFVTLTWFGHFAVYRARRYRLTRTVFRGLRFHQSGAAWRYAVCALLWWTAIILTLGLAYPWAQASLERYKMRHTFYGDLAGRFAGSGTRLFFRGIVLWLLVAGPLAVGIVAAVGAVDWEAVADVVAGGGDNVLGRLEGASPDFAAALVFAVMAVAWSVVAATLLYPAFQTMMLRWWASGLRFGEMTAQSHLRTGQVYGIYVRFLGYAIAFAIVAAAVAAAAVTAFRAVFGTTDASEGAEIVALTGAILGYVVVMLGYSTIYQVTVKLRLWKIGFEAVQLSGLHVLEQVKARGAASSPFGEGLADALNVGGM